MKIVCIGDSLTEGDYGVKGCRGIGNVKKENYPYFLGKLSGAEVVNLGKCGATPTSYYKVFTDKGFSVDGADIIIVMLGTNGGLNGSEKTEAAEYYKKLIAIFKTQAPKAEIVICTPPHATENPLFSNCGYMPRILGAVEFVRELSKQNGLDLIDVFACPAFTSENEHIMQANDGLHFVEEGYKALAACIFENLKKLYPKMF